MVAAVAAVAAMVSALATAVDTVRVVDGNEGERHYALVCGNRLFAMVHSTFATFNQ